MNYNRQCWAVGGFGYADRFYLYVELNDRDGDTTSNKSYVDYNVYCNNPSSGGTLNARHNIYFSIDGQEKRNETVQFNGKYLYIASGTIEVYHNDDGNKTISFYSKIQANSLGVACELSGDFTLNRIDRYAYFAQQPYIAAKTETSIDIGYRPDRWVTGVEIRRKVGYDNQNWSGWYPLNSDVTEFISGEWNSPNQNSVVRVKGLNGNNWCKVQMRIQYANSLWTESYTTEDTTYDYPHITDTPNFAIRDAVWLGIYNPLNRNTRITMYGNDWSVIYSGDGWTGTSIGDFISQDIVDNLYKSIRNQASGNYHIKVSWNGIDSDKTNAGTYWVRGDEKPIFKDFYCYDEDGWITQLTGNSQNIVLGYSNILAGVDQDQVSAQYHASISKYRLTVGDKTTEVNASNYGREEHIGLSIHNVTSNAISVDVIDSRGLATRLTKYMNTINYFNIGFAWANAERANKVGSDVTLNFGINYWNGNFGAVHNYVDYLKYRYKPTYSSNYTEGETQLTYWFDGNMIYGSVRIKGDLGASGFNISQAYNIQLEVRDALSTSFYDVILGGGSPAVAIYKNKVAIGGKYDPSIGGALQVYNEAVWLEESIHFGSSHNYGSYLGLYWKEQGYGDKFSLAPIFNGVDDDNVLAIMGAVGDAGTDPALRHLVYIRGKSGTIENTGRSVAHNGYFSEGDPNVLNSTEGNALYIKRGFANTNTPQNGVVLEFGTSSNWGGQLFFADNAYDGVWYNGWSNGVKGSWKKLSTDPDVLYHNSSGSSGTITLNQSAADFNYIEIFFSKGWHYFNSVAVYNPNGKEVELIVGLKAGDFAQIQLNTIYISDTTIFRSATGGINFPNVELFDNAEVTIHKVLGYKRRE